MATILVVYSEPSTGLIPDQTLGQGRHRLVGASSVPEVLHVLAEEAVDLIIISDYRLPGLTGPEFLALLSKEGYDIPLIMLAVYPGVDHTVASISTEAIYLIAKQMPPEQLNLLVDHALELVRLRRVNEALLREVMEGRTQRQVIGESIAIRQFLQTVCAAASTEATVLLLGETGTGKELFARAIHTHSGRGDGPFIMLNCAALPEGLAERALFGHEVGAFTGAKTQVQGAFEQAHRGTLLLKDIPMMRPDLQAKLLRAQKEQEFTRLGGTTPIQADVRIIATGPCELLAELERGSLGQSQHWRASTIPLLIPPLRERPEDIPLLALHFATRAAAEIGKPMHSISPDALAMLQRYHWPGNVRELQHAISRAVILSQDSILQLIDLDAERFGLTSAFGEFSRTRRGMPIAPDSSGIGRDGARHAPVLQTLNVNEAEKVLIRHALEATGNNRTQAAKLLGISVRTLRYKLNKSEDSASEK